MFGLLQPNRIKVGKRIRAVKEELGVSLTEFGKRLDLIKPTMNAYVQGYSLAPLDVIEKISKISGKKVGWFYFGEIEDYIQDYLLLKGHDELLSDYPMIPAHIKEDFLKGDFKNPGWENEFGYPCEEFLDDCFSEIYHNTIKEYITSITTEFIETHTELDIKQKDEAIIIISTEVYGYFYETRDIRYEKKDKSKLKQLVEEYYERHIKYADVSFDDYYLVGKLINILNDDIQTSQLISDLAQLLTDMDFSYYVGGQELIDVFQSLRPALIKLYAEKTNEDYHDWFGK